MKNKLQLNKEFTWLPIILFLSAIFSACGHYTQFDGDYSDYKIIKEKTFDTSPGKNLLLKASSGDVVITTSDSSKVYVKILGNERAYKKVKFNFDNSPNGIEIIAERKDGWNFFNFGEGIKLRFEIILPKNYNAKVSSSGGDISLKDLNGSTDLHSSGGDISLQNTSGSTLVSTSGGDIEINNNSGNLDLKTSGGDIKAKGFNGNVSASSSGGDIILEGSNGQIDAHTSGGEIKLNYNGQNMGIKLVSSGGDIEVKLPNDFSAKANLYASGGDIQCDFTGNNVQKITSSTYEADFNNGGKDFIAKTSGGDITIRK